MDTKLQVNQSIEVVSDAISTHLREFGLTHQATFTYRSNEDGYGIQVFLLEFSKEGYSWTIGESSIGSIRLRSLNPNLTELLIRDSHWFESTVETVLTKWRWDFPNDMPLSKRKGIASKALEGLQLIHKEVREYVLTQLKEDRLLGTTAEIAKPTDRRFVDGTRIAALRHLRLTEFDLTTLIRICEELNCSFSSGCFLATAALVRTLIDHVPPIFKASNFSQVASNIAGKSTKASLERLDKSSRNIADAILHHQIRKREVLPTATQVDFSHDLDVLLGEIIRELSK